VDRGLLHVLGLLGLLGLHLLLAFFMAVLPLFPRLPLPRLTFVMPSDDTAHCSAARATAKLRT
jgi:hypothetical protein